MDSTVFGATEGEHVSAPISLGELGDPVTPLERALVVAHGGARRDQEAARPGARDRDRGLAAKSGRRCLVKAAHALRHPCAGHQRCPLDRKSEHLQIWHLELPPELGRAAPALRRRRGLATGVRHVPLEEGKPAVLGPRLERVKEAMGATEPTGRHRGRAMEVELIACKPGGHAGRVRGVSGCLVEVERTLTSGENRLGVVEPPRRPAQPLERLGRLPGADRLLEQRPSLHPMRFAELAPASIEPGRSGLVGFPGHACAFLHAHAHRARAGSDFSLSSLMRVGIERRLPG